MEVRFNNLIQINGISNKLPQDASNFNEINLKKIINKFDNEIKKLLRSLVKIDIINSNITNSFKGISNEGQKLTNIKLYVEGQIIGHIEYISNDKHNCIYKKNISIPFYTDIVLNNSFHEYSKYNVTPYIEDIFISKVSNNRVLFNVLFVINVTLVS